MSVLPGQADDSVGRGYSGPVVDLTGGDARYRDDIGEPSPAVAAAMAAYAAGTGCEHAVLAALADSRLLVPVLAMPAEDVAAAEEVATGGDGTGPDGRVPVLAAEKRSHSPGGRPSETPRGTEMATPALVGRDGRRALVAFTCADAVRRWQPAARPVPVPALAVFQAATEETCAVVVDVAGPVPLAVEGARLAALAGGGPLPRMYEDPDAWQLVAVAAGRVAPGIRVRLSTPPPGAEFTLELAPPPGVSGLVPEDVADQVARVVREQLSDRVRSAVAVVRRPC
jgi:SseB protein N-terminal domain